MATLARYLEPIREQARGFGVHRYIEKMERMNEMVRYSAGQSLMEMANIAKGFQFSSVAAVARAATEFHRSAVADAVRATTEFQRSAAAEAVRAATEAMRLPQGLLSAQLRSFAGAAEAVQGLGIDTAKLQAQFAAVAPPTAAVLGWHLDPELGVLSSLRDESALGTLSWLRSSEIEDDVGAVPVISSAVLRRRDQDASQVQQIIIEANVTCERCGELILEGQRSIDLVTKDMRISLHLHVRPLCIRCLQDLGEDYVRTQLEEASTPPYELIPGGGENPSPTGRPPRATLRAVPRQEEPKRPDK